MFNVHLLSIIPRTIRFKIAEDSARKNGGSIREQDPILFSRRKAKGSRIYEAALNPFFLSMQSNSTCKFFDFNLKTGKHLKTRICLLLSKNKTLNMTG